MWIRERTRWAVYLRDGLRCVYCSRTAAGILHETPDNFLTLDHFETRRGGGGHKPNNLVTCCYECNRDRGRKSLLAWCEAQGWSYDTIWSRVYGARRKSIEPFREAAGVLLGGVPGVPRADLVVLMAWRARRQWAGEAERGTWEGDGLEICGACSRVLTTSAPPDAPEPIPF